MIEDLQKVKLSEDKTNKNFERIHCQLVFSRFHPEQVSEKKEGGLREKAEETIQNIGEQIREESDNNNKKRSRVIGGLILLGLGALFLINNFLPRFSFGRLWPLILIIIGLAILAGSLKGKTQ